MRRFTVRLIIAFITFMVGVAAASIWFLGHYQSNETQFVPPQSPAAEVKPAPSAHVNGLEIPGLSKSHITTPRRRSKLLGSNNIYMTVLSTKEYVIADFFRYGRQENGEFVSDSPKQYGVHQITRYDVAGQPFCYQILANPPGIATVIAYEYYDDDGDGRFDRCVSGRWPRPPIVAAWVLQRK